MFPAAKLIQRPSLWSQGEVVTNRMWRFAIHCHSHGMHVWSHDPLCCADAEPTRGEGCASRSLQSLNYCGRKKKGSACSLTTAGLSTKIWTLLQQHPRVTILLTIRALVRPSSERIRNFVPMLFHLPAPWCIRRSPDERLALETFCALRGNFSVDSILITTPTQSA